MGGGKREEKKKNYPPKLEKEEGVEEKVDT